MFTSHEVSAGSIPLKTPYDSKYDACSFNFYHLFFSVITRSDLFRMRFVFYEYKDTFASNYTKKQRQKTHNFFMVV